MSSQSEATARNIIAFCEGRSTYLGNSDVEVAVHRALAALDEQREALRAEIDAWKSATMLIDSGGDPSGITPDHLERHIAGLRRVVDVATTLQAANLDRARRPGTPWHDLDVALADEAIKMAEHG